MFAGLPREGHVCSLPLGGIWPCGLSHASQGRYAESRTVREPARLGGVCAPDRDNSSGVEQKLDLSACWQDLGYGSLAERGETFPACSLFPGKISREEKCPNHLVGLGKRKEHTAKPHRGKWLNGSRLAGNTNAVLAGKPLKESLA